MHRLLPQSLFVRIMLIVVGGLLISELVGGIILIRELDDLMLRSTLLQISRRIEDHVTLLESVSTTERERLIDRLNATGMIGQLVSARETLPSIEHEQAESVLFESILRGRLGSQYHVQALVASADSSDRLRVMSAPLQEGKSTLLEHYSLDYWVQLRLKDGQQIRFFYQNPSERPTFALSRLMLDLFLRLLMVMIVALISTRLAMRPLKQLANSAEALGRDLRRDPMPETGLIEVQSAAKTFNLMQTRLMTYLDDRTRILAAISHDLRTPLTRLRLRLEMLGDDLQRQKLIKDVEEMRLMVESTLDFVRGVVPTEADAEINLAELIEHIQSGMGEQTNKVLVRGQAAVFLGKPLALKRCLTNLIENALRYGDEADIALIDQTTEIVVLITDNGPGIAATELDKVFEPFYRVESSRSKASGGIGLGLSIARDIAQAHGGRLTLENLPDGGLQATLVLPRHIELN